MPQHHDQTSQITDITTITSHGNHDITTSQHHSQNVTTASEFAMAEETPIVRKPGFHWQGDQVDYVLSRRNIPLAKTVIASSIPAVKFLSNEVNYYNHFAKLQTAQGTR